MNTFKLMTMRNFTRLIAPFLLITSTWSEPADNNAEDFRRLSSLPGVETTESEAGGVATTEWKKAGVTIRQDVQRGTSTIYGFDDSGKGAILCTWMTDVIILSALEMCASKDFANAAKSLSGEIDQIEAFMTRNRISDTETKRLKIEKSEIITRTKNSQDMRSVDRQAGVCGSGDIGAAVRSVLTTPKAERVKHLHELLSVERWAVLNPCL